MIQIYLIFRAIPAVRWFTKVNKWASFHGQWNLVAFTGLLVFSLEYLKWSIGFKITQGSVFESASQFLYVFLIIYLRKKKTFFLYFFRILKSKNPCVFKKLLKYNLKKIQEDNLSSSRLILINKSFRSVSCSRPSICYLYSEAKLSWK